MALWSFKRPVLISGPLVSSIMAHWRSLLLLKASLSLPTVSPWTLRLSTHVHNFNVTVWSPWEKLSLATVIPLSSMPTRVSTSQQAGLKNKFRNSKQKLHGPNGADDLALSVGVVRLRKDVFKGEQVKEVTFINFGDHVSFLRILEN